MNATSTMTLENKILAYVNRTPGCTLERISIAMGFGCKPGKGHHRYPDEIKRAVRALIRAGEIEFYKHPFADRRTDPVQVYATGLAPSNNVFKEKPKSAAKTQGYDPTLKISVDPSYKIEKTVPRAAAHKAIEDRLKLFKAAVDDMEARNTIEPLTHVSRRVCSNEKWGRNNDRAFVYYTAACARIKAKDFNGEWEPILDHRIQRLEQQLMMRTARIDELQKALAECQTLTPRQWLAEQHEFWGQRALANDEDSPAAARNAEAFRLLLDLYEVPQSEEA